MSRFSRAGFTLVELMVAIAIVGVVSIVIYNIFDTTSQNYYEVNQLADLNNRARFATETVRNHLAAAGAQGSPDSVDDDRVFPKQAGIRVTSLVPYAGWQDDRSVLPAGIAANNPEVTFDGVVVVGAIDFPLSFELAGMQAGPPRFGRIYGDKRGIFKLTSQDLFDTSISPPTFDASTVSALTPQWTTRVLRVADRQGFYQFIGLSAAPYLEPNPDDLRHPYASIPIVLDSDPLAPQFKGISGTGNTGLDIGDGDIGYDAGLLDSYWFHVEPSLSNPDVMTLVRERLCTGLVVQNAFGGGWNPATALANQCGGTDEKIVVASNVADFQVWFDCADNTDGTVTDAPWDWAWATTDHTGDCMDVTTPKPGEVRGGHVRLALHTSTERANLAHIQFEDAAGAVCDPTTHVCAAARVDAATLRTYDFFPETEGAARVVVVQTDFEIPNLVNRNVYSP